MKWLEESSGEWKVGGKEIKSTTKTEIYGLPVYKLGR